MVLVEDKRTTPSPPFLPGWVFLLTGLAIGRHLTSSFDAASGVLELLQSAVNHVVVPIYTLFVIAFLLSLAFEKSNKKPTRTERKKKKRNQPLEPSGEVAELPTSAEGGGGIAAAGGTELNLSGSFKLVSNENFENFLAVQGVPWVLRGAADKARPTHAITHTGDMITIQIRGIIESETTYHIGGPPVQTVIRGRTFHDRVAYLGSGDGIMTTKTSETEDYTVEVERRLSPDKQWITMTNRVIYDDHRKSIICVQKFERME